MKFLARFLAAIAPALVMTSPAHAFVVHVPMAKCHVESSIPDPASSAANVPEQTLLEAMRAQQATGLTSPAPVSGAPSTCAPAALAVAQPGSIAPLPSSDGPDVFGSVALHVAHTPLDAKWRAASAGQLSTVSEPWTALLRKVSGLDALGRLSAVNFWVNNRVQFADDRAGSGASDHWSGASETLLHRRGDCEDYAIAKMKLLEAAGVARGAMYLVIADDLVRRADHALLVVRLGARLLVLDSSTDQILDSQAVADYRPIFSYGEKGAWIHGYAEPPVQVAARY